MQKVNLLNALSALALLLLAACKGGSTEAEHVDEAERAIESEEQAREVAASFEGTFEHSIDLHGEVTTTKLVLMPNELRQLKNDLVVFTATCERNLLTQRRMSMDCTQESGRKTYWPFEMSAEGNLVHRAQPELIFTRVTNQVE